MWVIQENNWNKNKNITFFFFKSQIAIITQLKSQTVNCNDFSLSGYLWKKKGIPVRFNAIFFPILWDRISWNCDIIACPVVGKLRRQDSSPTSFVITPTENRQKTFVLSDWMMIWDHKSLINWMAIQTKVVELFQWWTDWMTQSEAKKYSITKEYGWL